MPRLFFGVPIPTSLQEALRELRNALMAAGLTADSWSNPALYHITLVFLGDCVEDKLSLLDTAGAHAVENINPFELTIQSLGMFEQSGVLWTGIAEDVGAMALRKLQARLVDSLLSTEGFALESRPFRPHLTLARKVPKHQLALVKRLRTLPEEYVSSRVFAVEDLCLFESTRVNGQLVYPVVEKFQLGKRC